MMLYRLDYSEYEVLFNDQNYRAVIINVNTGKYANFVIDVSNISVDINDVGYDIRIIYDTKKTPRLYCVKSLDDYVLDIVNNYIKDISKYDSGCLTREHNSSGVNIQ